MISIRKHIEQLYPDQLEETILSINELIEHYSSLIDKKPLEFTQKDVVLIAYADSFKDAGKSPLQSLSEVAKQYLYGLINSIHILPFYPFTSDDGFSVTDYKSVNPEFGVWNDIEDLGKDFYLMFDAVINHISQSSDWFQTYLKGDKEYSQFFIEEDPGNDDLKKVVRPRTLPLLHPFNKQGKETYIWTTFSEDQLDLNYANPLVFIKILDVLLFYISKGARFIRLDAIAFLWKKLGTDCLHLPETHMVIQLYRSIIEKVAPQTILITETNVPHKENISYFGNGENEAHMIYNFSLPPLLAYSLHAENVDVLTTWAQSLKTPSNKTCLFNFTASHDGIGVRPLQGILVNDEIEMLAEKAKLHGGFVGSKSNSDGSKSPYELNCNYMDLLTNPSESNAMRAKRLMLNQSVMLSFPGIPGIYYHTIFGSENDINGAINSGINRRINREKLYVNRLQDELKYNNLRSIIYSEYKNILEIRKQYSAFSPFCKANFYKDNNLFIVERENDKEKIICLHNFSHSIQNIEKYIKNKFNLTHWKKMDSELKPYEFLWLKA